MNKVVFAEKVAELVAVKTAGQQERKAAVNDLIEAYVIATGERPDSAQLDRLAEYIMLDDLSDADPYKVAHTEYPFLSARQLELRRTREVSLKVTEETGTDGHNYRLPKRRKRSRYENWRVDANAKARNTERADQYRKDTSPGRVVPYNLRENGGELMEPFVQCRGLGDRWRHRLAQ